MKGYLILVLITCLLLVAVPPFFLKSTSLQASGVPLAPDQISVSATDGERIHMGMEEYVKWATVAWLPADASIEAIKAVAVAQRSYAQFQMSDTGEISLPEGMGLNTHSEAYWIQQWGEEVYRTHIQRFETAVKETQGIVMTCRGQPVMAVMHMMNHGYTDSAENVYGTAYSYLESTDSPHDAWNPERIATIMIPEETAVQAFNSLSIASVPPSDEWFTDMTVSEAGTVKEVKIGDYDVSGADIRRVFSLPSSVFRVSVQEGQVIFTVQGKGDGVGMSAYGCVAMAKEGATWKDILTHYYKGVDI